MANDLWHFYMLKVVLKKIVNLRLYKFSSVEIKISVFKMKFTNGTIVRGDEVPGALNFGTRTCAFRCRKI